MRSLNDFQYRHHNHHNHLHATGKRESQTIGVGIKSHIDMAHRGPQRCGP